MIPALMGLPGKIKTLIDRLTSTRAANLDNLDAAVTTRAPAATALSSATWSSGLAAYLSGAALHSSPTIAPPIALIAGANTCASGDFNQYLGRLGGLSTFSTTSTTDVNALSYAGAGVLSFCAAGVNGTGGILTVIIDGVTVYTSSSLSATTFCVPVGYLGISASFSSTTLAPPIAFESVPFASSVVIKLRTTTGTAAVAYKYRRTA